LGLEFVVLAAFDEWLKRYGTLNVPERVEGREAFLSPAQSRPKRHQAGCLELSVGLLAAFCIGHALLSIL
jgi:hypothetical protein